MKLNLSPSLPRFRVVPHAVLSLLLVLPVAVRADSETHKEASLRWLQSYRKSQVLFHDKDIQRVVDRLQAGTEEEAEQWLQRTEPMRAALDSPEWKKTREALRGFLRVQAIYSDEEIDEFRHEVRDSAETSTEDFLKVLQDIEDKHRRLVLGHRQSEQLRKQKLQVNEQFKQQQVQARRAAQRDANRRANSGAPLVGSSGGGGGAKRKGYRPPAPLVNSLDVARWTIFRSVYPRR